MIEKNKFWAFFDSSEDVGADSLKFVHADKDEVFRFVGEYVLSSEVRGDVDAFKIKELKVGAL